MDRAATVMLTALAVIAATTLLPQSWQQRLLSWGCQGATFGVTDCVARLYEPPAPEIRAVPQCPVDQVLERMVPTVERQTISFASGAQIERWVERGGDIRLVALPEIPDGRPADAWASDEWPTTPILSGVNLPLSAQWRFAGGAGERELVAALQQQHAHEFQRFSALAAFLPGSDEARREGAVRPDVWVTQSPVDQLVAQPDVAEGTPEVRLGHVRLGGTDVTTLHDEARGEVFTTVASEGVSAQAQAVEGVVRWSRSADGVATSFVGTWAWQQDGRAAVTHLYLPLAEGDGATFEEWLVQEGGAELSLDLLLAERGPGEDRFEQLVAASGLVAYEERETDVDAYLRTVAVHLAHDRRPYGDLSGERAVSTMVRPQPSGMERTMQEVQC